MIELWRGDLIIDIIPYDEWCVYLEEGGYRYVWCEGYGQ